MANRLRPTLNRLKGLTPRLLVLGDNPDTRADPATCLSAHLNDVPACVNSRTAALEPGKLDAERTVAAKNAARFVDTSDWLCTDTNCPIIIGDILLFRDINHLTTVAPIGSRRCSRPSSSRTFAAVRLDALEPTMVGTAATRIIAAMRRLFDPRRSA